MTRNMALTLNRKRSRLDLDDDEEIPQPSKQDAALLSPVDATLKRKQSHSDLEDLEMVAPDDAWHIDVQTILASPTLPCPLGGRLQAHNNANNYSPGASIMVFCVQGNLQLHYDLLW